MKNILSKKLRQKRDGRLFIKIGLSTRFLILLPLENLVLVQNFVVLFMELELMM